MKRMMFALLIATMVGTSSGCCILDRLFCRPCAGGACGAGGGGGHGGGGCSTCGPILGHGRHAGGGHGGGGGEDMYAGQGMGATAYPYYTTRGPRDFLAKNPRSIGP